jgi:hypothetical protein
MDFEFNYISSKKEETDKLMLSVSIIVTNMFL